MPLTVVPLATIIVSIYFVYIYKKHILIKVYRSNLQPESQLSNTMLIIEIIYIRYMLILDKAYTIVVIVGKRGK